MKGVSAVIAVILILMITVALAAMAYVWFTSVFQSLTEGASGAAEQTSQALGTSFAIESAVSIDSEQKISVSLRNTGSTGINLNGTAFYISNLPATKIDGPTDMLEEGEVTSPSVPFILNATDGAWDTVCPGPTVLRVTVAAGFSQTTTIVCP